MLNSISRVFGASALVRVSNIFLGFLSSTLLVWLLGAEQFGIYSYIFIILSAVSLVGQLGLPRVVLRETASAQSRGDWQEVLNLWRWGNRTSLLLSMGTAGLFLISVVHLTSEMSESYRNVALIGACIIPLMTFIALNSSKLRGLGNVVIGQVPELVLRQFFLSLIVGSALLMSVQMTAFGAMTTNVLSALITLVVAAIILRKKKPPELHRIPATANKANHRGLWSAALFIAITAGMNQITNYSDILILGMYQPMQEVGIYRIVYQLSLLVIVGLHIASMVVAPKFAATYANRPKEELANLAVFAARFSFFIALPIFAVFVFFGKVILGWVFGPEFALGYFPLVILGLGQVIYASFGTLGVLLNMTGHEKHLTAIMTFSAFLNIILNLSLVPKYGMAGAAAATLITFTTWNILLYFAAGKILGIKSNAVFSLFEKHN